MHLSCRNDTLLYLVTLSSEDLYFFVARTEVEWYNEFSTLNYHFLMYEGQDGGMATCISLSFI